MIAKACYFSQRQSTWHMHQDVCRGQYENEAGCRRIE